MKTPVQEGIPSERDVEPGVQQQPAVVDLQQHAGHRLAVAHRRVPAVDGDRLGEVFPAEGQGDYPVYCAAHCAPWLGWVVLIETCPARSRQPASVRIQVWLCRPIAPPGSSNSAFTTAVSVPIVTTSTRRKGCRTTGWPVRRKAAIARWPCNSSAMPKRTDSGPS